jgi:glucose/arabinose dehydrogenase
MIPFGSRRTRLIKSAELILQMALLRSLLIWSWGHRNAQGIVFGSNGILYSSEQQDKSDDEVNIIKKGGN